MELRQDSFEFLPTKDSGPISKSKNVTFLRNVKAAAAGLTGYTVKYDRKQDHHLGNLDIRLVTTVSGRTVTVTGMLGLRDWSGEWDDSYSGHIDFTVVADVDTRP